ncbi:hypothetical protein BT96DRAFT_922111 [Gymnopus androsaceus JB14]|uniref:Uncharacterized protein n=1 Tax=Gymnopus androsaceus JB14 TaxID=1447944 RepID=A0A6A4HF75_9AGAR|nr:hypothetical protein BT96DRAFT_922111 [Gymnopus androsaceus JB14]
MRFSSYLTSPAAVFGLALTAWTFSPLGGEPEFRFPNNCYTRLDAQFNMFNFKMEKGGLNGRCQYDMECVGFIFLAIGPWDVGGSSIPGRFLMIRRVKRRTRISRGIEHEICCLPSYVDPI